MQQLYFAAGLLLAVPAVAQDVPLDHGHVTTVTASLGVAITRVDHAPQESLLLLADRAMYAAKALGGNGVSVADE